MMVLQWLWPVFCGIALAEHSEFPEYFQFGSASASYQIEGGWNADGKGPSIWDNQSHAHPHLFLTNGDIASDSYHRYREDVQLLRAAGVDFYRFSISWPRIMPTADVRQLNEPGLQYYDNLINELLANKIAPMVTMFHWDLPQWQQDLGGMLNPDVVWYFEQYANVLFSRYGDRVSTWITINEPGIFCLFGYGIGAFPPFVKRPGDGDYLCSHHSLMANAQIYDLYRSKYRRAGVRVGIALDCISRWPKDPSNATHVAAAERAMEFTIGNFLQPLLGELGGYPPVMVEYIGRRSRQEGRTRSRLPTMTNAVRSWLKGKADFIGLNYYTSNYVAPATEVDVRPSFFRDQEVEISVDPSWPRAKSEWLYSVPQGLRATLNWLRTRYGNPVVIITENSWSDFGEMNDIGRIEYFRAHLQATLEAIDDGCNVIGHTTWSLLDSIEWDIGFSERFGLHHVNFDVPERTRTPKASVAFLRNIYASRTVPSRP